MSKAKKDALEQAYEVALLLHTTYRDALSPGELQIAGFLLAAMATHPKQPLESYIINATIIRQFFDELTQTIDEDEDDHGREETKRD